MPHYSKSIVLSLFRRRLHLFYVLIRNRNYLSTLVSRRKCLLIPPGTAQRVDPGSSNGGVGKYDSHPMYSIDHWKNPEHRPTAFLDDSNESRESHSCRHAMDPIYRQKDREKQRTTLGTCGLLHWLLFLMIHTVGLWPNFVSSAQSSSLSKV